MDVMSNFVADNDSHPVQESSVHLSEHPIMKMEIEMEMDETSAETSAGSSPVSDDSRKKEVEIHSLLKMEDKDEESHQADAIIVATSFLTPTGIVDSSLYKQHVAENETITLDGTNNVAVCQTTQQHFDSTSKGFIGSLRRNSGLVVSPPPSPTPSCASSSCVSSLSSSSGSSTSSQSDKEQETMVRSIGRNHDDANDVTEEEKPKQKKHVHFDEFAEVTLILSRRELGSRICKKSYFSPYEMELMRERERQLVRDISAHGAMNIQKQTHGRWQNDDIELGVQCRIERYHRRQRIKDAVCSVLLEQELLVQTSSTLKGGEKDGHSSSNDDPDSAVGLADVYQEYTYESTRLAIHRAKINARQVGSSDITTDEMATLPPKEISDTSSSDCSKASETKEEQNLQQSFQPVGSILPPPQHPQPLHQHQHQHQMRSHYVHPHPLNHPMMYPVPYHSSMSIPIESSPYHHHHHHQQQQHHQKMPHTVQIWNNVIWDPVKCQYVQMRMAPGHFVSWSVDG